MISERDRKEARTALAHFRMICSKYPELDAFIKLHGTDGFRREDCPHNPDMDENLRLWMTVWGSDFTEDTEA